MKKSVGYCGLFLLCVFGLAGCSGDKNGNSSKYAGQNSVDQVLENQMAAQDALEEQQAAEAAEESDAGAGAAVESAAGDKEEEESTAGAGMDEEPASAAGETDDEDSTSALDTDVDIDLTEMSSDMVYATVYQLMVYPESYVGKTIKMAGAYYASWYEPTLQYYHYVIIQDATACCAQGMEFVWEDGSHIYPDEYPEDETEIEVVGVFETYMEDGDDNLYCRLRDASLVLSDNQ